MDERTPEALAALRGVRLVDCPVCVRGVVVLVRTSRRVTNACGTCHGLGCIDVAMFCLCGRPRRFDDNGLVLREDAPLVFCCGHDECVKALLVGVVQGRRVVRPPPTTYTPYVYMGEDPQGWEDHPSNRWRKKKGD